MNKTREHYISDLFDCFDVDKCGSLSLHELYKICRVLVPGSGKNGFTNEELRERFAEIDVDGNRIEKDEFVRYMTELVNDPTKQLKDNTFVQGVQRVIESVSLLREIREVASRPERLSALFGVISQVLRWIEVYCRQVGGVGFTKIND